METRECEPLHFRKDIVIPAVPPPRKLPKANAQTGNDPAWRDNGGYFREFSPGTAGRGGDLALLLFGR